MVKVSLFLSGTIYLEKPCDFHPKIEVAACFLEYEDKILLLHRQDHTSQGNLWGIPGGKLERTERPINAAIREVHEETGYDISYQPITDLGKVYIKYPDFDYIYHMTKCKLIDQPGGVKINFSEHKGFTWVTPQDTLRMHLMSDEDGCIELIYKCGLN
jgi:8-oxo-dGTP pyrophosphatase MutT (NUDIX family)